ncbi:MFS transporter permease [Pseudomonas sp. 8Z]|uniref:MFS transporter permease n=1 Tax=Pseudomonas sp. 8Z TaxID=2653166 RepID=UPI0012F10C27|nr:MFS transporter permease [Pseudomonas sp. 8Z]VXC98640.1 MFS transporter permease [Pseudomonas sp. 8Z]
MDNLYQPPKAELLDEQSPSRNAFFVTSENKLYLLYFFTFGIYAIYWFYKQWDSQRTAMLPKHIMPAARSIFHIFYTHSLCRLISEHKQRQGLGSWAYSGTAWIYVVLVFTSNGLSRMEVQSSALDLLLLIGCIMAPAVPLAQIQQQANQASVDDNGQSNARISGQNLLFIIPGALLWMVVLVGVFI